MTWHNFIGQYNLEFYYSSADQSLKIENRNVIKEIRDKSCHYSWILW
jgi:hypothetical protein